MRICDMFQKGRFLFCGLFMVPQDTKNEKAEAPSNWTKVVIYGTKYDSFRCLKWFHRTPKQQTAITPGF